MKIIGLELNSNDPERQEYINLRKRYKHLGDGRYDVVLGVVNRGGKLGEKVTPMTALSYTGTREFFNEQMEKFVGKVLGETDQGFVRERMNAANRDLDQYVSAIRTISIDNAAGVLESYTVSGIRDGSGSLAITGIVKLTPRAIELIESGLCCFGIRALITKVRNESKVEELCAFDLIPVIDL